MKKIYGVLVLSLCLLAYQGYSQGNALSFDGINDYVDCGNNASLNLTGAHTISCWVYQPVGSTLYGLFLAKRHPINFAGNYEFYIRPTNVAIPSEMVYWNGTTMVNSGVSITPGRWQHVAVVHDGAGAAGKVYFYLNGNLVNTQNCPNSAATTDPFYIGRADGAYSQGRVDEVRIYSTALTLAQIREDMHRELVTPLPAGLKAYYTLNEGSGTTAADVSGNGNTGTLTNGPTWITSTAPIPFYTVNDGNWNAAATWQADQNGPPVNSWARVRIDDDDDVILTTSPVSVKSLEIKNTGSLTINETKFFTVSEDSLFNTAGTSGLTIKSSASGDGSLIHKTASVPATVERYLTGGKWHTISSPISNATANIFLNEYLQEFDGCRWVDIYDQNTALTPMKGYAVYVSASATYSFVGNLNGGVLGSANNIISTSCPGGTCYYTLVGNPYPCAIDLDAASGWTRTNLNATTNIENSGAWAAHTTPGIGSSQYVAMGQGFLIQANSSPATLMMDNPIRVHNTVGFLKSTIDHLISLEISGENNLKDVTYIYFRPESTENFDGQYDGMKILASAGEIPQIYSVISDNTVCTQQMVINAMPQTQAVPIGLTTQGGAYTITATEINSLDGIRLEDKSNGTFTDLAVTPYTFTLEPGQNDGRFVLHFYPLGVNDPKAELADIYSYDATLKVNMKENGNLYVYSMTGQLIMTAAVNSGSNTFNLNASTGNYIVKIVTSSNSMVKKVFIK